MCHEKGGLARRAQKWEPVLREKARQNKALIIGRDSKMAPDDLGQNQAAADRRQGGLDPG